MREPRRPLAAFVLIVVAACAPEEARVPLSERARDAPPPRLAETALFDAALARAAPDAERLEAEAAALAARAEALRARAASLSPAIIPTDARGRLAAAAQESRE
jgi:hypothetical protein